MVELKTHAAQLGWNTCNPSLLLGFAFCWHIYFKRPPFFISSAWLARTPMNQHIHTSHVTPIHILSTIRHYSFPLAVHPVNSYVVCYIDSLISFVNLNFFRLQCFHWPTMQPLFIMFIFRFILFMFGPTCANKPHLSFYLFSGHNYISTKMVVRLFRLMPSTVCSYPMVSSTWSCPKA